MLAQTLLWGDYMETKYFLILFCLIILVVLHIFFTKSEFKLSLEFLKRIIVLFTIFNFLFIILEPQAEIVYKFNFIKAIIIMLSLSFLLFSYGLIVNDDKTYKNNINFYIIFYLILLVSITFFIKLSSLCISLDNLNYIKLFSSMTPFKTISSLMASHVSTELKVVQLFGNIMMLVPLTLLLMIKDKKYENIINISKIILPLIIIIEFTQVITDTGIFDIDDIILNYSGVLLFTFLITRFLLINKIKILFYQQNNFSDCFKYILFTLSLLIPVYFIFDTFVKSIIHL